MSERDGKGATFFEKGKKTGYYKNTFENRKKGIVGQKYTIEVTDKPLRSPAQKLLDRARDRRDLRTPAKEELVRKVDFAERKLLQQEKESKEWLKTHVAGRARDWRINDERIRRSIILEEVEASEDLNLTTDEAKITFVEKYEESKVERAKNVASLIESLFLDSKNERLEEELIWIRTKDLESVMLFNIKARTHGVTQMLPEHFVDKKYKPELLYDDQLKIFKIILDEGEVSPEDLSRETFMDHVESQRIWETSNSLESPLDETFRHWELDEIEVLGGKSRKDFLARQSILELKDTTIIDFLARPYDILQEREIALKIMKPNKKFGSIIVSDGEGNDVLVLLKKTDFSVKNPRSKKKASIGATQTMKILRLDETIDYLNYELPVAVATPLIIEAKPVTQKDKISQVSRKMSLINVGMLQDEIDKMEKLLPYKRDEDELDSLYFQRNKFYELEQRLERMKNKE